MAAAKILLPWEPLPDVDAFEEEGSCWELSPWLRIALNRIGADMDTGGDVGTLVGDVIADVDDVAETGCCCCGR